MATSTSDIIKQNTVGYSEGNPVGVPTGYAWYDGLYKPAAAPPSDFTSVTAWGQVYQEAGAGSYYNPNATVDVANSKTYVHLKATGEWVLVQDQATTGIAGAHFVADFSGSATSMKVTSSGDTAALAAPPAGYNDHFWPTSRGVYPAGAIDGVYVQMDMKVSDPNLHLIANVGADWWRSSTAPYVDGFSNNPGAGMSNWVELSTEWKTLGFYSMSTSQFQSDLPPTLTGSTTTTPPAGSTTDTVAPLAPKITGFTPDTGTVGDKITTASVLTVSGTAEAGSTVKLLDGTTQIGTAKANTSGAWSISTAQLSTGTHNFTAKATDTAGNTSTASSSLSVKVDGSSSSPTTDPNSPTTGSNLLVNGSFEASSVAANRWAGFSSIPGWTALTGGTIELWNNLNNVQATNGVNFGELDYLGARDGLYQTVKTTAGQSYDLSFDARSRPGVSSTTTAIEVLWNDSVVATVPPGSSWKNYHFSVTGTGGNDKLTFREAAGQSADGLGALYDNVSLVPVGSASSSTVQPSLSTVQPSASTIQANTGTILSTTSTVPQSATTDSTTRTMDLMTQYSATSLPKGSSGILGGLTVKDAATTLAQTLATRSH